MGSVASLIERERRKLEGRIDAQLGLEPDDFTNPPAS